MPIETMMNLNTKLFLKIIVKKKKMKTKKKNPKKKKKLMKKKTKKMKKKKIKENKKKLKNIMNSGKNLEKVLNQVLQKILPTEKNQPNVLDGILPITLKN